MHARGYGHTRGGQDTGALLARELHRRILKDPSGEVLRAVVAWQGKLGAIYRAFERTRVEHVKVWDVSILASLAAMSHSASHQAIKTTTG